MISFWSDIDSTTSSITYTKTGIHIKTTEDMLNNISTSTDCTELAKTVLQGFQSTNRVEYKRDINSVVSEIYFHVQMEKYARINSDLEVHEHTKIIDLEQDENYWDFLNPNFTDSLDVTKGVSCKYETFINSR